ncbi:MAG: hypothetical protein HS117_16475 [Verrucomicrobiaceae bacterium]|jgi:hypothetical protein|nr:hypothetical protein [Verrucomicrobiaceae bacterium]
MKTPFSIVIVVLAAALLALPACKSADKKKDNRTGQARLIGVIEMVNPEQNYVLINCEQRHHLPAGTELIVLDATGGKSKIVITPERKGNYLTADIKEGMPAVSSLVLLKLRESDTLPAPPAAGGTADAASAPASLSPVIESSTGSLPPIPAIEFPRGGSLSQPPPLTQDQMLPLPKPLTPPPSSPSSEEPPPDLSKLPPVVR